MRSSRSRCGVSGTHSLEDGQGGPSHSQYFGVHAQSGDSYLESTPQSAEAASKSLRPDVNRFIIRLNTLS